MFANMSTFELPQRESCRRNVSFEFLYGTCLEPFERLAMVSPSALNDLLMNDASTAAAPSACDFFNLSEPAKSINDSFP